MTLVDPGKQNSQNSGGVALMFSSAGNPYGALCPAALERSPQRGGRGRAVTGFVLSVTALSRDPARHSSLHVNLELACHFSGLGLYSQDHRYSGE